MRDKLILMDQKMIKQTDMYFKSGKEVKELSVSGRFAKSGKFPTTRIKKGLEYQVRPAKYVLLKISQAVAHTHTYDASHYGFSYLDFSNMEIGHWEFLQWNNNPGGNIIYDYQSEFNIVLMAKKVGDNKFVRYALEYSDIATHHFSLQ